MSTDDQQPLMFSNRYSSDSVCAYCDGIIRHEPWCVTRNVNVHYAHRAALFPNQLSLEDRIILHALGVAWRAKCVRAVTDVETMTLAIPPTTGVSGLGEHYD